MLRALGLGDLLTALPALRAVHRRWPDHSPVLAAPGPLGRFLVEVGAADVAVDTRALAPVPWSGPPPDVAVNLHGCGPQSHRALLAMRPAQILAYAHRDVAEVPGPAWDPDEHEVDRWCRLLATAGAPVDPTDMLLPPVGTLSPAPEAVVVHPGAASGSRRWPVDRFADVARTLRARGLEVVVTGSAEEARLAGAVAEAAGLPASAVLAGRTPLPALAALLQHARLLICGDTGVGHLGTACGTPTVHLFGPEPPARWGPRIQPERHVLLWHPLAHGGAGGGDPHADTLDPALAAVSVGEVLDAAGHLLDRALGGAVA
ncbi:MAG: glycosyltransferase family 9 protein [Actinomycetota bacterium]|nr:glycosyltransferase family 9 protein [Actinomycetota bacterium]